MAERFDSWKGFLDAGFVAAEDGSLRLGDAVALYSVAKEAEGLGVKFSGDVPGYEDIAFSLPTEVDDFYEWVARIACGTFGAVENWDRFREKVGGLMNSDLEQMITIGIDHLDEIETDGANAPEEDVDSNDANGVVEDEAPGEPKEDGAGCASSDDWSSCLRKIVKDELAREWPKLSDAAQAQDIERSQAVMDRVNRLKAMDGKIAELADEWKALGLVARAARWPAPTKPEGPVPTVPPNPKPKPEPKGPMGFAVTFEDGVRIAEAKASVTFAKTIEKIGAERVAALGLKMAGDPLVTQDKDEIKKMPMMVQPVADGWFVKTHSNTYTKMEFLRRIGEALDAGMKFETFRREPIEKTQKKRGRGRPPKHPRKQEVYDTDFDVDPEGCDRSCDGIDFEWLHWGRSAELGKRGRDAED